MNCGRRFLTLYRRQGSRPSPWKRNAKKQNGCLRQIHFSSLIPKMLTFSLAISCLITANLPWFMDLNIPGSYALLLLQHQTLVPSPVTSTTGCYFCFGSISSFFLELFLYWSPVAYWVPTDLGSSSFSVLSFCLFILFTGFSRQEYWNGLLFSFLVKHILSELTTTTCRSWVALHGMAHSFIESHKAVVHVYLKAQKSICHRKV